MIRQLIGLLFYCLLAANAFGQENESLQKNADPENYLGYYHSVAFAEEFIVNGQYENAIKCYQKTFKEYAYNNPVDCYVAAQVASYIRDTASCLNFLFSGICFGLPVKTIISNPHLAGVFRKTDPQTVDSCWMIYQNGIDTEARARMLGLIKIDQSLVKSLVPGESLYEPDGYTLKNRYRKIWDSLVREVVILTGNNGFPAQKIIGTQNGEDSLFNIGPNSVFVTYIFIHHGNAWNQIGKMLWTELLKGNITPQMYGVLYESSNGKNNNDIRFNYLASRPCQDQRCKSFVNHHLNAIDSNRWKIGLGSYKVMQKKFESRANYFKWCQKKGRNNRPFFDFQCDLSFQGV